MRVGSDMTGRHRIGTPSARLDLALRNSPSRTTVRPHTHPAYSRRQADDDRRQGRALIIQFAATAGHNCRDFILFVRRKHVLRGSGTKFAAHACTHLSPHFSTASPNSPRVSDIYAVYRIFSSYKRVASDGNDKDCVPTETVMRGRSAPARVEMSM